jgi:hypothetical protein
MLRETNQSIKPYRPPLPLRERARRAFEAELESEAAERADALVRAQRAVAAGLVFTCQHLLRVELDPSTVAVEMRETVRAEIGAVVRDQRVVATAIVESIRLSVSLRLVDAARFSGQTSITLFATPLCPVCASELALPSKVARLADLGRAIGEIGCAACDWTQSEAVS